jgi:hypothetical protein
MKALIVTHLHKAWNVLHLGPRYVTSARPVRTAFHRWRPRGLLAGLASSRKLITAVRLTLVWSSKDDAIYIIL